MKHLRPKWSRLRAKRPRFPWKIAVPSLAAALAGLAVFVFLAASSSMIEKAAAHQVSRSARRQSARADSESRATQRPPGDSAYAFESDNDFLNSVEKTDKPLPHWDQIARSRPSAAEVLVSPKPRTHAALMECTTRCLIPGEIREDDPKPTMSGMIDVRLDPQGRLTYFEALPPEKEESARTKLRRRIGTRFSPPLAWICPNSNRPRRCGRRSRHPTCARPGPANGPDTTTARCAWRPPPGMAGRSFSP